MVSAAGEVTRHGVERLVDDQGLLAGNVSRPTCSRSSPLRTPP
ncbi:hypothetical protein AB0C14_24075 [Microbispora hainanensis]